MTNQSNTRTGMQVTMSPEIEAAVKKLKDAGIDMTDPVMLRRFFRALVTLGAQALLDRGAPPEFIAMQAIEAIGHEIEKRTAKTSNVSVN